MGSLLFPTVTNLFELSSYRLKAKMTQLQVENQLDQRGEVECCYRKMGGGEDVGNVESLMRMMLLFSNLTNLSFENFLFPSS